MIRTLVRVKLLVPAGLGLVLALAAVVVVGAIAGTAAAEGRLWRAGTGSTPRRTPHPVLWLRLAWLRPPPSPASLC